MDKPEIRPVGIQPNDTARGVYYRLGGLLLAFAFGGLSILALRYLFNGRGLQLAPDVFISLVFTVAIGAASLVLALLAINYGRISERVITERADRSIEIQMNLFEKSLDLQTRLFDKTMSTLESIGRSTGVTEQRLGDMLTMFQNPAFMKQVAGRAVEETASELGKKAKEGAIDTQTETQLAEKLTQNIVRELSARFEGLERAVHSRTGQPAVTQPFLNPLAATTYETVFNNPSREPQQVESPEDAERKRRYKERIALVRKVIDSIPEIAIQREAPVRFWDFRFEFKGKKFAVDTRLRPVGMGGIDESIKNLLSNPIDCLIFAFVSVPPEDLAKQLEQRSAILGGRVKYVVGDDESTLHNELLGILESVAAALPSTE